MRAAARKSLRFTHLALENWRNFEQVSVDLQRRDGRQVMISTRSTELLTDEGIGLDEVLLLEPAPEGTLVRLATELDDIKALLANGVSSADLVMPHTATKYAAQLALFGD